ncbi:gamma-glutamyl-gamma-aminobutyrate hydrolase family protein [Pseudonocardia acidicola]|uniref:Gamma-glutamyl-gamma-aminobutyrate hydrolase family protein n=1 Tax=Pseudonocardia acidicola TaxID=2724939 RepID=A0ABX1SB82_9PSEU|nr:gamma-glutamyl-gamma-aminobutyrate hydrolase family protein [Pseudonocardia acidicola]NMH98174.1 gamma-glutamyl-gamma-aminobutyrate hydrolase family protein [Pseudonocardia acidicola]
MADPPRRPLIGLTTYGERARYLVWDHQAALLPRSYVDVVTASGGAPVLLPPVLAAAEAVAALDALILTGGPDIGPGHYGAAPHPEAFTPRPERDATELVILHRALDRGIPVLGVCRGAQLLNVGLGGTLSQHLPEVLGHERHNPAPGVFGPTAVRLTAGSRTAELLGERALVHCHHHQAIDRLGRGLVATGRAEDGTIEAVELAGHRFVVGVQWHPEQDVTDIRLVSALVRAAELAAGRHEEVDR